MVYQPIKKQECSLSLWGAREYGKGEVHGSEDFPKIIGLNKYCRGLNWGPQK